MSKIKTCVVSLVWKPPLHDARLTFVWSGNGKKAEAVEAFQVIFTSISSGNIILGFGRTNCQSG